jgi:FkbM family methyltransferase
MRRFLEWARLRSSKRARLSAPWRGITRDHIIWAYRLLLDREPENDRVVDEKLGIGSVRELRTNFLISTEFRENNRRIALPDRTTIVIKEIEPGLRLFLDLADQDIGLNIALDRYEPEVSTLIRRATRPGSVAIDIGANIGYCTMLLAQRVGPGGHVYAYEPINRNADLLDRSTAENDFGARITLARAAVGDRDGSVELISPLVATNWGGASIRAAGAGLPDGHTAQPAPLVRLDTAALRRPVELIKIDVEGAELLALRGARALLEADRPLVLAELNPEQLLKVSGASASELIEFMRSLGYSCYLLSERGPGESIARYDAAAIVNVLFAAHGAALD